MKEKVTLWDRLTYYNRFTDRLMRASGMTNWRRDKRQMIPFAVSIKCALIIGALASFYTVFLLWLLGQLLAIYYQDDMLLNAGLASFVLALISQFLSNCWWNARAMKLNAPPKSRPVYDDSPLPELPEILR